MHRYYIKRGSNDFLIAEGENFHHIKNVVRLKENEKIECIYLNKLYLCSIINFQKKICNIKIINEIFIQQSSNTVIAGIPLIREQKYDIMLQKICEIGVDIIIPISFKRSVVKIQKKDEEKKILRWNLIAKSACQQSKKNQIPQICNIVYDLNNLTTYNADIKIIAWENEKITSFKQKFIKNIENKIIFYIIGPEGGIETNEIEILKKQMFIPISLGSSILRAETAAIYVASILNFLTQ